MDEFISKETILKKLTSDLEHHSDEGEPLTHLIMRRFIKYIEDFPAADVQPVKWISVKDRLPEEMQDKSAKSAWSKEIRPSDSVLILTTSGSYDVAWYSYSYEDWTADSETHSYEKSEVAFWQPLPKLPKDGEQND